MRTLLLANGGLTAVHLPGMVCGGGQQRVERCEHW